MHDDRHDLVVRTIREHACALLRTARRHSLCADDAHDAYQRAREIFLRRVAHVEPDTAIRWLHVVVKHEAQAVRAARQELVGREEANLDARVADALPDADERLRRFDRLSRSAEALARLKPQEVRALWLKAQGHSYAEIAEREGWTYTKVNRCLTEGRRAFLDRYAGIEMGEECERWAPVVSAMVDGEASAEDVAAARPHLRRCAGCRATVRELHAAGPRLAGVLPVGALGAAAPAAAEGGGPFEAVVRAAEGVAGFVHERAAAVALKVQLATEAATATKVAAVAASTVAIAGGGVAVRDVAGGGEGEPRARAERGAAAVSPAAAAVRTGSFVAAAAPTAPAVAGAGGAAPAAEQRPAAAAPEFGTGSAGGGEFAGDPPDLREFSALPHPRRDPEGSPPRAVVAAVESPAAAVEPREGGSKPPAPAVVELPRAPSPAAGRRSGAPDPAAGRRSGAPGRPGHAAGSAAQPAPAPVSPAGSATATVEGGSGSVEGAGSATAIVEGSRAPAGGEFGVE